MQLSTYGGNCPHGYTPALVTGRVAATSNNQTQLFK